MNNNSYMTLYVTLCAMKYHFYNLKNVKNTQGGVLLLVKLQASACNFTKTNTSSWVFFFTFLKFYKCYEIALSVSYVTLTPGVHKIVEHALKILWDLLQDF